MIRFLLAAILLFLPTVSIAQTAPETKPPQCMVTADGIAALDKEKYQILYSGIISAEKHIYTVIYSKDQIFQQFIVNGDRMCHLLGGSGIFIRQNKTPGYNE